MKIAKQLKSFGARLFGNNSQYSQQGTTQQSIVHISETGRPVRTPLTSFQPVVAERRKIPTGTIKAEADKLKFIGLDVNNHPVYVNDPQMHAHVNMGRGLCQVYSDADLAKARSSNIQAKVVIRAGGEGK